MTKIYSRSLITTLDNSMNSFAHFTHFTHFAHDLMISGFYPYLTIPRYPNSEIAQTFYHLIRRAKIYFTKMSNTLLILDNILISELRNCPDVLSSYQKSKNLLH